MELVEAYATLLNVPDRAAGIHLLQKIEWAGRISHRSEEAQTADSWERFLTAVVLGHGDWSIVEHASVTVDAVMDRGITHEWVRHRLFSFTMESTRFVNYEKKMPPRFLFPAGLRQSPSAGEAWTRAIVKAEEVYRDLVTSGIAPQHARSVLPNALAARIVTSGNLRNWRHFLLMRTTKESHPQMREVTIPLLAQFQARIPLLFDDIVPQAKQADNLAKAR